MAEKTRAYPPLGGLYHALTTLPRGVPTPTQPLHGWGDSGVSAAGGLCHARAVSPHGPSMAEGTRVYPPVGAVPYPHHTPTGRPCWDRDTPWGYVESMTPPPPGGEYTRVPSVIEGPCGDRDAPWALGEGIPQPCRSGYT